MASADSSKKRSWLPLESEPGLINRYIHGLGVPATFQVHDVFGLDPELLQIVPRPCLAVLLLFPITEASEAAREAEGEKIAKDSQTVAPGLWYTKQTVGNACGTVGILHAILNNRETIALDADKFFARFHAETLAMTPDERAAALEENDDIEEAHQDAAASGESHVPATVNLHFACFVRVDGDLYELDGRKASPINHGPCDELLGAAAGVIRQFMARDPDNVNFNVVSLGTAE